jgi:hypothetical protein
MVCPGGRQGDLRLRERYEAAEKAGGVRTMRLPSTGRASRGLRGVSRALLVLGTALALGACGHMPHVHWPWTHRPPPAPELVHELVVTTGDGGSVLDLPEFWKRNTLVLDLEGVSGAGGVVLRPRAGMTWPMRLALRVKPGAVGQIEVRADQRLVIPITTAGVKPVDLELAPGIYTPKTEEIRVNWAPTAPP